MGDGIIWLIVGVIFVISNIVDFQKKKRQKAQKEQERLRQSQSGGVSASQTTGQRTMSPIPGALRPLPRISPPQPLPSKPSLGGGAPPVALERTAAPPAPPAARPAQPQFPSSLRDLFSALEKKMQEAQGTVVSPQHVEAQPPPPVVQKALPPPRKPVFGEDAPPGGKIAPPVAPTPVGILERAARMMPSGKYPVFDARMAILFSEILGPPVSRRPRHTGGRVI